MCCIVLVNKLVLVTVAHCAEYGPVQCSTIAVEGEMGAAIDTCYLLMHLLALVLVYYSVLYSAS